MREKYLELKKETEKIKHTCYKACQDRDYYAEQVGNALDEASFHATKYYELLKRVEEGTK